MRQLSDQDIYDKNIAILAFLGPDNQKEQCGDENGENTAHNWSLQSHNHNQACRNKYKSFSLSVNN